MIFEKNKKFLSSGIIKKFADYKPSVEISFIKSKEGFLVPSINNQLIHSSYYPMKESRNIKQNERADSELIAVGFGAGYHLKDISDKKKIIAVAVDLDILFAVTNTVRFDEYLNQNNLIIILPEETALYFDFFNKSSYDFIIHPALEKILPDKLLEAVKTVKKVLNGRILEINTQRKFGKIWLENFLRNTKMLISGLFDFDPLIIDKKPILVCGAGYSLFENINLIRRFSEKLFIASSDTALKVLTKSGIMPDAVFSFDPQNFSYLHFTGIGKTPRIFSDFISPLRFFKNQTLFFSNHPLKRVLIKAGFETIEVSSETKNIGSAIIDFFTKYFSDYPVITAGIDFGVYNNNLYSRGSYINEYINNSGNYYISGESLDAKMVYREKFIKECGSWKSNPLLESYSYSSLSRKNIFTLSTSPYIDFTKTDNLTEIIDIARLLNPVKISFNKPAFSKKNILDSFKESILNNPEILASYFLYLKQAPDKNVIEKIIDKAERILY